MGVYPPRGPFSSSHPRPRPACPEPTLRRELRRNQSETLLFCAKHEFTNPLFSAHYTLFQVPYPVTPLFATLTKTTGVYTNSSHFGTPLLLLRTCRRFPPSVESQTPTLSERFDPAQGCFLFFFTGHMLRSTSHQPAPRPGELMNRYENWFCASSFWRYVTRRRLLPWILAGSELGDHVLEIGAGPGAATEELRRHAARVTSLEYDHSFAASLAARQLGNRGAVLQGDAAALPFPNESFSSAIAVLVLHHLRSREVQDRAFTEIFRVLRPGGIFLAFEIQDGWLQRVGHIRSTFVPVVPATVPVRLTTAGFSRVTVDFRRGAFRVRALRAAAG
jgi:SAM-dependent methyltransferase